MEPRAGVKLIHVYFITYSLHFVFATVFLKYVKAYCKMSILNVRIGSIREYNEASHGVCKWRGVWRRGTKCDCKTDWLWVRSSLEEMKYLLQFIFPFLRSGARTSAALSFATQHVMPP